MITGSRVSIVCGQNVLHPNSKVIANRINKQSSIQFLGIKMAALYDQAGETTPK